MDHKTLLRLVATPPDHVEPEAWTALHPWIRARLLWQHHGQVAYDPQRDELVRQVPEWATIGPESGAPFDWFNEQGVLLPRYRPGGSGHQEFETWRLDRATMGQRWAEAAVAWRQLLYDYGWWTYLAVAAIVGFAWVWFSPLTSDRLPEAVRAVMPAGLPLLYGVLFGLFRVTFLFGHVARARRRARRG